MWDQSRKFTYIEWLLEDQKTQTRINIKCQSCANKGEFWSACGFEKHVYESYGRHMQEKHTPCDHKTTQGKDCRILVDVPNGELWRRCTRCMYIQKFQLKTGA